MARCVTVPVRLWSDAFSNVGLYLGLRSHSSSLLPHLPLLLLILHLSSNDQAFKSISETDISQHGRSVFSSLVRSHELNIT